MDSTDTTSFEAAISGYVVAVGGDNWTAKDQLVKWSQVGVMLAETIKMIRGNTKIRIPKTMISQRMTIRQLLST